MSEKCVLNIETTFSCLVLRILAARFIFNKLENGGLLSGETGPGEKTYCSSAKHPWVSPHGPKMRLNQKALLIH